MSRRARLFSEFLDGSDVGGLTTAPTASSISQDVIAKRRKTSGLNSRFDRMIETINLTHRSATRKRARSTSSASGSSVPKTPIDDYDDVHRDARLGAEFSVIKMGDKKKVKRPVVLPWEQDSSSSDIAEVPTFLFAVFNIQTRKKKSRPRLQSHFPHGLPAPSRP
ncbi:hypothetical protein K438DRAFT_146458 [Mycena galopus ATCC 62051]|nr:hypothetical protein K438DRAFT_146458 [Mycena galopus ATCC 62051]